MTQKKAILAGGCFWGMQDLVRKLPGVHSTCIGYSGGDLDNATYRNHGTHAEAGDSLASVQPNDIIARLARAGNIPEKDGDIFAWIHVVAPVSIPTHLVHTLPSPNDA